MFRQTMGMILIGSLVVGLSELAHLTFTSTTLCLMATALAVWLMTSTPQEGEE